MNNSDFKAMYDTIPHNPGVYRFISPDGVILYVGKAKNLRKRLSNYFGEKKNIRYKTKMLTKHAARIEFTIVESEHDALLLENTLIKENQPRYNVSLKDGKSYTYIVIKNERFPRVFFTRKVWKDGSTYFGPYTSKARVKVILETIKKIFTLRTCTYNLSEENIEKGKFKVCLEYHIKNCKGCCEGLESEEDYNKKIEQIKNILKGNFQLVKEYINREMEMYASNLQFEKAHEQLEKLDAFTNYQSKSMVVNPAIKDLDVFCYRADERFAYVSYLKIVNGALINTDTIELEKNLDEDEADLMSFAIPVIRERFSSIAKEVVVPFDVVLAEQGIHVHVPQRGDKRKLLQLCVKNLDYFLAQKRKQEASKLNKKSPAERILTTLKNDLQMSKMPIHIECFDNSNIQGSNPVSSCVVFKNGKPSKKDYRHFKIKTVIGPNDFASMTEVVGRRYKRMLAEGETLPQLIIIDGGKGQLSSSVKALEELGIQDKVTIVGIAKKLEEIFFPGDSIPLYINKKSESLKLIQHCRNEAHRFAINFHRDQRSKSFLKTELTEIPGVGDKTAQKLLKHYGSVKKLRAQPVEEVSQIVGAKVAKTIIEYFAKMEG